jgi:hypothetical protein
MNYLGHAISLYQDKDIINKLKIDYTLAEDRQEKIAIKLTLLNLGHRIKEDKQE